MSCVCSTYEKMCIVLDHVEPRIFAVRFHPLYSDAVRDFLVSTCEPLTRPASVNEFFMSSASLAAAASEGRWDPTAIARQLVQYAGLHDTTSPSGDGATKTMTTSSAPLTPAALFEQYLQRLPKVFRVLLGEMDMSAKLQLVLHRRFVAPRPLLAAPGEGLADHGDVNKRRRRELLGKPAALAVTSAIDAVVAPRHEMAYYLVCRNRAFFESLIAHDKIISTCLCMPGGGDDATIGSASLATLVFSDRDREGRVVYKAEVKGGHLRELRRQVQATRGFHIDVQYDYRTDTATADVPNFRLKDSTRLRSYQEASLERFLRGGNARNGVVVLPCGAGKTLTGVAAAAAIGKPTIVMCINELSVRQWRSQFAMWSALSKKQITVFTGKRKDMPADVFITTYSMMTTEAVKLPDGTYSEGQAWKAKILEEVEQRPWGLMLLDEVHGAPAADFQRVLDRVKYHCVLGLTATLLREDGNIGSLRHLVGPKLYEANWLELTAAGHLATAHCVEVRCSTPAPYVQAYMSSRPMTSRRTDIEALNPTKLWCTQALVHYHTVERSPPDKVIIFCDSTHAVRSYAHALGLPFMEGRTKATERHNLLSHFRQNPKVNCVILSRVGDTALDIPEASIIIQVSGLFGSRRQEAQRLGRILRPKPPSVKNATAVFYSLVSTDTDEVGYSFGRQQWLRDQGFAYRVIDAATVLDHFHHRAHGPGRHLACIGHPTWQYRALWLDGHQRQGDDGPAARSHRTEGSSLANGRAVTSAPVAAPLAHDDESYSDEDTVPLRHEESYVSFPACVSLAIDKAFLAGQTNVVVDKYGTVSFDAMDHPATHGMLQVSAAVLLDEPAENPADASASAPKPTRGKRGRGHDDELVQIRALAADDAAAARFEAAVRKYRSATGGGGSSGGGGGGGANGHLQEDNTTSFRLRIRRMAPQHNCRVDRDDSPCVLYHLQGFVQREEANKLAATK
jgi:superfamily II DNA or RNA helicase